MRYPEVVPKAIKQRLTRQESRLETRTKLLESAAQLFAKGGYEGASVDLIAESAGYSKGAFYSNFKSKEAIFLALLDAHKRREIEALAQLLARDIPASELVSLIRNSESDRVSDFDFGLLSAEFQLQACRDKTFAKTYAKLHRTHVDTMAGLITRLFAKLDRTPPVDAKGSCRHHHGVDDGALFTKNKRARTSAKGISYCGDSSGSWPWPYRRR